MPNCRILDSVRERIVDLQPHCYHPRTLVRDHIRHSLESSPETGSRAQGIVRMPYARERCVTTSRQIEGHARRMGLLVNYGRVAASRREQLFEDQHLLADGQRAADRQSLLDIAAVGERARVRAHLGVLWQSKARV